MSTTNTKKKKKEAPAQLAPVLITSREGMLAVVNDIVKTRLRLTGILLKIEKAKAEAEREYQSDVDDLQRSILSLEGGLQVWSIRNPQEFDGKKSIDLPSATFGFRTGPHKVDKIGSKDTWDEVLSRLISASNEEFDGTQYARYPAAVIDKDAILDDRENLPMEVLQIAGIRIIQDEFFFFTPKSEILEGSTTKAVA